MVEQVLYDHNSNDNGEKQSTNMDNNLKSVP